VLFSFTNKLNDNDCNTFYPIVKGNKWVYNEYDKKDDLYSVSTTAVENVITNGSTTEYVLHVKSEDIKAKKNEEPFEDTISYFCENGLLSIDLSSYLPKEYNDMEVTMEQKKLTIPSSLEVGQKLDDAQMIIYVNGMQMMQMDVTNRKVEKKETVSTEAGDFDCALITYDMISKIAFATITHKVKDWISPEVGQVMSETYDKNGKKINSRKLKEFTKGNN
jgi:hypothetical protein